MRFHLRFRLQSFIKYFLIACIFITSVNTTFFDKYDVFLNVIKFFKFF